MGNKKACHMAEFAMFVRILVAYHERLLLEYRKVMEICVTVPQNSELNWQHYTLLTTGSTWFQEHVRTSQYFTQIVKCDENCC